VNIQYQLVLDQQMNELTLIILNKNRFHGTKNTPCPCLTSIDEQNTGILYGSSLADMVFQKFTFKDLIRQ
jgi:hypothetical protein